MRQKQYKQPPRKRQRKPRRKRKNGLAGFFLSVIVITVIVFGSSMFFKVSYIEVEGESKCSRQDIIDASGISIGDFLLYINKGIASSSIRSNQSYADTIKIRAILPNRVVIHITECEPVAFIRHGGEYWIADKGGKLLEPVPDKPKLPEITGLTLRVPLTGTAMEVGNEDSYKTEHILDFITLLSNRGISAETVEYNSTQGLTFTFLGRFKVIVGMPNNLDDKLDYLNVYLDKLEPNAAGTIYLPDDGGKEGRFIPS
ncbi:MAG: FtsQ-type POTRA domain-containing protein [Oscillospiraceae bacterium]|nr:FtsQ-type POTRA domain-containing protein [Oscillospiraceae bacterium]